MTHKETTAIMAVIFEAYPYFYSKKTDSEIDTVVSLWAEMFADDPAEVVAAAVKAFIVTDTKGFPPVIGIIKQNIVDMTRGREKSEYEAWGEVKRALNNANYGSTEEFEKLSPDIKRIVGNHMQLKEWAAADLEDLNTVIASNFQRSYRDVMESSRKEIAIGGPLGNLISELSGKMQLSNHVEPPKPEPKALPISVEATIKSIKADISQIMPKFNKVEFVPLDEEETAKRKALIIEQFKMLEKEKSPAEAGA